MIKIDQSFDLTMVEKKELEVEENFNITEQSKEG